MTDIERRLRDLGERAREVQGSNQPPPSMKRRISARRFSTVALTSLVTISVVAVGTLAARAVTNSSNSVPPAGSGNYSVESPAEVLVVSEDGWLEDPGLNLAWGRVSDTAETLACVGYLPPETSRVELLHEETGDVLSWGKNFVAGDEFATVCAHNLDAEVLVGIANHPSMHRLVIDDEIEIQLVRTEAIPMVEPTEVDCDPTIDFEPTYLPRGWVPELQEGAADEDPFGNIAGHYGAEGPPGAHRKIDAGFINLVAFGFRFEPPSDGDLIVLGQTAEFDEENGTIEFGFDGCAFALVGAGVGREELVPFAEGLRAAESSDGQTDQEPTETFAAIWPEDNEERAGEECTSIQHVDGHWRSDGIRTAERFATEVLGWEDAQATQSKPQRGLSVYVGNGPISSDQPTVIVHVDEVFGGCWSVISVGRLPEEEPEDDGSMSVRGRDVQMGFDLGDAASATFEVGYTGQTTRYVWNGGNTGVAFTLDFEPRGTGHFLVLLRDQNGEVFSAFGSPLPEGDFAAG